MSGPGERFDTGRLEALRRYAEARIEASEFAGLSWAVWHDGVRVARGLAGHVDAGGRTPMNDDTLFRIYSMTKPIVSVRAMQLVEQQLMRLDEPVARWIPGFRKSRVVDVAGGSLRASRGPTIEDLLTHRAGLSYDFLPHCPIAPRYREAEVLADGQRPLDEYVDIVSSLPLAFEPGSRWQYSVATDVLAHVLELVCERPIDEVLREGLFEPLALDDTGFALDAKRQPRLMQMFGMKPLDQPADGFLLPQELEPMDVSRSHPLDSSTFRRGGHGLYSTVDDYARFMRVLIDGRAPSGEVLLSVPALDWMWANRLPDTQRPPMLGFVPLAGYGWNLFGRVMIDTGSAMRLTTPGEGGWSGAASTFFWIDRVRRFSGLVMTQFLGSMLPIGESLHSLACRALIADDER